RSGHPRFRNKAGLSDPRSPAHLPATKCLVDLNEWRSPPDHYDRHPPTMEFLRRETPLSGITLFEPSHDIFCAGPGRAMLVTGINAHWYAQTVLDFTFSFSFGELKLNIAAAVEIMRQRVFDQGMKYPRWDSFVANQSVRFEIVCFFL